MFTVTPTDPRTMFNGERALIVLPDDETVSLVAYAGYPTRRPETIPDGLITPIDDEMTPYSVETLIEAVAEELNSRPSCLNQHALRTLADGWF